MNQKRWYDFQWHAQTMNVVEIHAESLSMYLDRNDTSQITKSIYGFKLNFITENDKKSEITDISDDF